MLLGMAGYAYATVVSVTLGTPADGTTFCGAKNALYNYTPVFDTAAEVRNCSLSIDGSTILNQSKVLNATSNSISAATSKFGSFTWSVTCSNATAVVTSASKTVNFVVQPCNINADQSIGVSFLNILKGGAQVTAGVLDKVLDNNFGAIDIAAVAVLIFLGVMVLVKVGEGAKHIQSIL